MQFQQEKYLPPVVDCFDGLISAWKTGTSPNADFVNGMLEAVGEVYPDGNSVLMQICAMLQIPNGATQQEVHEHEALGGDCT